MIYVKSIKKCLELVGIELFAPSRERRYLSDQMLPPVNAAGPSGSLTCSLAKFLHCLAFGRLEFISADVVQLTVNFTEESRRATEMADYPRRNKISAKKSVLDRFTIRDKEGFCIGIITSFLSKRSLEKSPLLRGSRIR